MTTEHQQAPRGSGAIVLLGAAVVTLLLGGLAAVVGGLVDGRPAALGALVGTFVTVAVFALGSTVVNVVAWVLPAASLLVALLTYSLQLLLMVVVLTSVDRGGLLDDTLRRGWLGGAVIGGTFVWILAQIVLVTRRRIPVYDLPPSTPEGGAR